MLKNLRLGGTRENSRLKPGGEVSVEVMNRTGKAGGLSLASNIDIVSVKVPLFGTTHVCTHTWLRGPNIYCPAAVIF